MERAVINLKILFFIGTLATLFLFPSDIFAASSVILQPNFQQISPKTTFKVDIVLRTDEKLVGADVVLKYDQKILEVASIDKGPAFDLMPFKTGSSGTINITGLTETSFTGTQKLATVNFVGKKVGETKLTLSYKAKSTSDSNLTTGDVKDVLSNTVEGKYQVGSGFERFIEFWIRLFTSFFIPLIIFLVFVGIAVYLYLRWKKQQEGQVSYSAPDIPLDRPPEGY